MLLDIAENGGFVASPEVQVFQPNQLTVVSGAFYNGFYIGDAGENRGDKAGGADAGPVEGFHSGQTAFYAGGPVHGLLEGFVQGVDGPGDPSVRKGFNQVQVPENQVAFGGNGKAGAAALELGEQGPGTAVFCFFGQVP